MDALLGNDENTAKLLQAKSAKMMGVVKMGRDCGDDDDDDDVSANAVSSTDRLKASFAKSGGEQSGSKMGTMSNDGIMDMKDVMAQMEGGAVNKRRKRPKPQNSKKKKQKKKSG